MFLLVTVSNFVAIGCRKNVYCNFTKLAKCRTKDKHVVKENESNEIGTDNFRMAWWDAVIIIVHPHVT